MKKLVGYIKQSISELKKVSWPSKDEVQSSTYVVIAAILFISLFLGLIDKIISEIIRMVIK